MCQTSIVGDLHADQVNAVEILTSTPMVSNKRPMINHKEHNIEKKAKNPSTAGRNGASSNVLATRFFPFSPPQGPQQTSAQYKAPGVLKHNDNFKFFLGSSFAGVLYAATYKMSIDINLAAVPPIRTNRVIRSTDTTDKTCAPEPVVCRKK